MVNFPDAELGDNSTSALRVDVFLSGDSIAPSVSNFGPTFRVRSARTAERGETTELTWMIPDTGHRLSTRTGGPQASQFFRQNSLSKCHSVTAFSLIRKLANSLHKLVNNLFNDGVFFYGSA
jgi:hypothetical protein